jgi:hypothetical protein
MINKLVRIYIDRPDISDNKYKEHRRYDRFHFIIYNYRRINQYLNMPSLSALEKFKASFKNLGLELQTLNELDLPFDDLSLPDNEPAFDPALADQSADESSPDTYPAFENLFDEKAADELQAETYEQYSPPADESPGGMDFLSDLGDLLGGGTDDLPAEEIPSGADLGEPVSSGQEDADFGNFIDTVPDDFATDEPPAELSVGDVSPEVETSNGVGGLPPGLINGLADEIEAERATFGKKGAKNKVPDEDSGMDFSSQDFAGLDLPDQDQDGQDAGLPDFDLDSFGLSAEEADAGTGEYTPEPETAADADGAGLDD